MEPATPAQVDLSAVRAGWSPALGAAVVAGWAGASTVLLFLLVHLVSTGYLLPGHFL
jgi:hypothetical protein